MSVTIDWCAKSVPLLHAFNRMFKLRHGDVPIQIIELRGTEDDIEYTIDMETEALYNEGLIKNNKAITDIKNTGSSQLFFLDSVNQLIPQQGCIYFVRKCCNDTLKYNSFDTTGAYAPGRFDYKELIEMLGFDGLSNEEIWLLPFELDLQHKVKEDIRDVANKTMLRHFERDSSNKYDPTDFDWVRIETIGISNTNFASQEMTMVDESLTEDEAEEDENTRLPFLQQVIKDANIAPEKIAAFNSANDLTEKTKAQSNVSPVINKRINIKDRLTPEDKEYNQKNLQNIKEVYEQAIEYINSLSNSRYTIIRNTMRECVAKEQFNKQFTKMYSDISEDRSTDVYKHLYDLDVATINYQKSLIRQAVHLGCVACNYEWDEDITFMDKGIHYIKCPRCASSRPFEKED